jgi:hypothetical protein
MFYERSCKSVARRLGKNLNHVLLFLNRLSENATTVVALHGWQVLRPGVEDLAAWSQNPASGKPCAKMA